MQTRTEPDPEVVAKFRKRKTRQVVASTLLFLALLPLFMLRNVGPDGVFGLPAIVIGLVCGSVVVAASVFTFRNWRCPACDRYLSYQTFGAKYCSRCGSRLQ